MEENKEKSKALAIKVDNGVIPAETIEELYLKAQIMLKTGTASNKFKSVAELSGALLHARQLGLPDIAVNRMYILNGTPCLYAEGPLALAQRSPDFHYTREYFVDQNGKEILPKNGNLSAPILAAVCEVKKKSSNVVNTYFFTTDDAEAAGLTNKGVWKSYFKDMLMWKARIRALRAQFPNELLGVDQYEDLVENWDLKDARSVNDINLEKAKALGSEDAWKEDN